MMTIISVGTVQQYIILILIVWAASASASAAAASSSASSATTTTTIAIFNPTSWFWLLRKETAKGAKCPGPNGPIGLRTLDHCPFTPFKLHVRSCDYICGTGKSCTVARYVVYLSRPFVTYSKYFSGCATGCPATYVEPHIHPDRRPWVCAGPCLKWLEMSNFVRKNLWTLELRL